MVHRFEWVGVALILAVAIAPGVVGAAKHETGAAAQSGSAAKIERGRYLVLVGGCNDCHTAGFLVSSGEVPEQDWLLGGDIGWTGPWGTTYAPNLRLTVSKLSEEEWIPFIRKLRTRPTMPWFDLNQWTNTDLRAAYAYIKSLRPLGSPAPEALPPGQQPKPPYFQFEGTPRPN